MLIIRDRLIQSALDWKTSAELRDFPKGCSQGGAAMSRREEASRRCRSGWLMGHVGGRASVLQAKSVSPAPTGGNPLARDAVTGQPIDTVRPAIMSEQWHPNLTDEVPRRLGGGSPVTGSYKLDTKGLRDASVAGTPSQWPRLQGCQQRQSRFPRGTKRQNRRQLSGQGKPDRVVSPGIQATKWPVGTSSLQTPGSLRNALRMAQLGRSAASI